MNNSVEIKKKLDVALEKALKLNERATPDTGVSLAKVLLFVLNKYNSGKYFGSIVLKFTGITVQNPREVEVTHRLEVEL